MTTIQKSIKFSPNLAHQKIALVMTAEQWYWAERLCRAHNAWEIQAKIKKQTQGLRGGIKIEVYLTLSEYLRFKNYVKICLAPLVFSVDTWYKLMRQTASWEEYAFAIYLRDAMQDAGVKWSQITDTTLTIYIPTQYKDLIQRVLTDIRKERVLSTISNETTGGGPS